MSEIIKQYYEKHKAPKILLNQKIKKIEKHPDIAHEFESWIQNGDYKSDGAVTVEGYTAKMLSELSKYLKGEGAFMMLIDLRENPKRALKQIEEGFDYK